VTVWSSEGTNYDYATNTCNGTCGHYTQIVWRATRKLGCAVADCPSLTFRTSLVCDYGPGGNTGTERPY
jgi:pathogenesis-related protein 1